MRFSALGRTKDEKKKLRRRINALETLHELEDPEFPLRGFPRGRRLEKLVATLKEIVATPSGRVTQTDALKKRIAVAEAYKLLKTYFDCHAFKRNRQEECVQMPMKIARSAPRPSFGLHLTSVLQESRENANIHAGFGFIRTILDKSTPSNDP